MNNWEEEFDSQFKDYGGRFSLTEFPENPINGFLENLRYFLKYEIDKNLSYPNVYLDFIDDTAFDAIALKTTEGKYFIGINIGVYVVLLEIFTRMLSDNKVLPTYGDIEKEISRDKLFDPHLIDFKLLASQIEPSGVFEPKCPLRSTLAYQMVMMCFQNLVLHEFSHIINGHLTVSLRQNPSC